MTVAALGQQGHARVALGESDMVYFFELVCVFLNVWNFENCFLFQKSSNLQNKYKITKMERHFKTKFMLLKTYRFPNFGQFSEIM